MTAPAGRIRRRAVRAVATVVVTALATAYLVWRIDLSRTAEILGDADPAPFAAALGIMLASVLPYAWRWQRLLVAKGLAEPLPWLVRSYLVSYTAGQILPTALGGDATRIYETSRRHPGRGALAAASVLLERALGGVATLALGAVGFALAVGHYDVGAYLWVELALVVATAALGFVLFSRRIRRALAWLGPLARRVALERPLRAVYEGIHSYRENGRLLVGVSVLTFAVQAFRVLAIWLVARAVGVDLSPRVYFVMGPLLFIVLLVPFTVNGLAVREAFFVSFLGRLGVDADAAFATGFLFFLLTVALALPGGAILLWETIRGVARPSVRHG